MAAVWKGAISFGLVNIPVELRPAVRSDHIAFKQLNAKDLSPIRYQRVSDRDGTPLEWSDIVKGYEYAKGKFVVLTKEDLAAAAPESSKTIDILDFVQAEEIDPRFFDTPYYVVPGKGGAKGYALLREAIRTSNTVGVGKLTLRQKQHLAGLKVVGDAIVLETMRFADELVSVDDLQLPPTDEVRPQELAMAQQLVANLAEPFDPTKYADDSRERLMRIIKAKLKGKKIEVEEQEAVESTPVIDLMARLRASLEQSEKPDAKAATRRRAGRAAGTGTRPRKKKTA